MVSASASHTMSASPEQVWAVISDPHRHVTTLPDSVSQIEVSDTGEISCVLSAMGKTEHMRVRRTVLEPPRLLVEERVDGTRKGRTEFLIAPQGEGSHVTLTAEVELPRLFAGLIRGHIESGLRDQLANLDRISAAAGQ
jgi:carbon monoxide dehydrogenase subunit G